MLISYLRNHLTAGYAFRLITAFIIFAFGGVGVWFLDKQLNPTKDDNLKDILQVSTSRAWSFGKFDALGWNIDKDQKHRCLFVYLPVYRVSNLSKKTLFIKSLSVIFNIQHESYFGVQTAHMRSMDWLHAKVSHDESSLIDLSNEQLSSHDSIPSLDVIHHDLPHQEIKLNPLSSIAIRPIFIIPTYEFVGTELCEKSYAKPDILLADLFGAEECEMHDLDYDLIIETNVGERKQHIVDLAWFVGRHYLFPVKPELGATQEQVEKACKRKMSPMTFKGEKIGSMIYVPGRGRRD